MAIERTGSYKLIFVKLGLLRLELQRQQHEVAEGEAALALLVAARSFPMLSGSRQSRAGLTMPKWPLQVDPLRIMRSSVQQDGSNDCL
jgi:hypothetical protein